MALLENYRLKILRFVYVRWSDLYSEIDPKISLTLTTTYRLTYRDESNPQKSKTVDYDRKTGEIFWYATDKGVFPFTDTSEDYVSTKWAEDFLKSFRNYAEENKC